MQKLSNHFYPIAIASAVMVISAISVKVIENTSLSNSNNFPNPSLTPEITPTTTPETTPIATPETTSIATPEITPNSTFVEERLSFGNKILVPKEETGIQNQDFQATKKKGIEEMAAGKYAEAAIEFEAAIQEYRNAPETLIYLNNARIMSDQNVYTIAVTVPIGSDANGALEILRGVAQAQNEVNQAGGINGTRLKVIVANDDDEPKIARQIASELVNNPEVLGVIGHFSSGSTLEAGKEYDAGKLVTISPVSTAVTLSDFSHYVFRTVPNDAIAAKELAKHMVTKLKKQKAAVFFNSQSKYSMSLKSKFIEEVLANGGQVDKELEFDLSAPSFSARKSIEQALARKTEVLMLAANTGMLDKVLLVIQANQKRLGLLGGDDVYAPKILADGGEAGVGLVVAVAWHIDGNPASDFSASSQKLWQGKVNWRTATSYDATQALIAALKRDPTRSGVQQALSASNFSANGASGVIKFLSSGDRNSSIQLVEVRPSKNPATGYEFVPIR